MSALSISQALQDADLSLPEVAKPVAAYVSALALPAPEQKILVRTSGQLPLLEGKLLATGQVGEKPGQVSLDQAQAAAQQAALNALAAAAAQLEGNVDRIEKLVKLTVFVSSDPEFYDQALVANGASETMGKLFTEGHIRSAVGVAVLPLNASVEVEAEFLAR